MTFTVNGVGTRYVGNANRIDRPAECPACKRPTRLSSYDTRVWFVVLFLPVIPLQKLRVIDQCPRCTRHRVISYAKWMAVQDEARTKASSIVQETRDDPASAIEAHRTLLGAQLSSESEALADAMRSRFQGSIPVHLYLADVALMHGRQSDAQAGYARAHALDPDHPAAREGLARFAVANGKLDVALDLMKPVVDMRSARGPLACRELAAALVSAQRHAEAHAILTAMLEMFPTLAGDKAFAKLLKRSEQKLGLPRTKLPVSEKAKRRLIVAASLVLLAMVGVVWADRHAAANVTLHVLDSTEGRLMVDIGGAGTVLFEHPGRQTIQLSEGHYTAHVTGVVQKDIAFDIQRARWPSFFDTSVHVLDASGHTLLLKQFATYSPSPKQQAQTERVLEAAPFERFTDVDYAFCEMPASIEMSSSSSVNGPPVLTKVGLEVLLSPPEQVVGALVASKSYSEAMLLAQSCLTREPSSPGMMQAFVEAAKGGHFEGRAYTYLTKRLAARPCDVPAQRAWLAIHASPEETSAIKKQYARLAESEPDEGTWALLAGMTSTSLSERIELLTRATADARVEPYALGPLAAAQASAGDWNAALASAQRAMQGEDADRESLELVDECFLALGRTDEFEHSLRDRLELEPCDLDALYELERLFASRDGGGATEIKQLEMQMAMRCPQGRAQIQRYLEIAKYAARGDFDEMAKHARTAGDPGMHETMLCALAEAGHVDQLRTQLHDKKGIQCDPYVALGAAVACRAGHDDAQAREWEDIATEALGKHGLPGQVTHVLHSDRTKSGKAALDLPLRPHDKAIVLALISFGDEPMRMQLLEQALALRPPTRFPRATIERIITDAKGR